MLYTQAFEPHLAITVHDLALCVWRDWFTDLRLHHILNCPTMYVAVSQRSVVNSDCFSPLGERLGFSVVGNMIDKTLWVMPSLKLLHILIVSSAHLI